MGNRPGGIDRIINDSDYAVVKALYDNPELLKLHDNGNRLVNRQLMAGAYGAMAGAGAGIVGGDLLAQKASHPAVKAALVGAGVLAGTSAGAVGAHGLMRAAGLKNYKNFTPEQAQEMIDRRQQGIINYLKTEAGRV